MRWFIVVAGCALVVGALSGCPGETSSTDDHATLCASVDCGDHGACVVSATGAVCDCETGWSGSACDGCDTGFHDEGGSCVADVKCQAQTCSGSAAGSCEDSTGVATCTCNAGYSGTACEGCDTGYHRDSTGACVADASCAASDPCAHGACDDTGGTLACTCERGWTGALCDACASGFHDDAGACLLDETCLSNTCSGTAAGTCVSANGLVGCACNTGYTGSFCETCDTGFHRDASGACVGDASCAAGDPCVNGTCADADGILSCACSAGWTGALCDTCAPGFHDESGACVLDQTCFANTCSGTDAGSCGVTAGVVTCACNQGYTGTFCDSCATGYHRDAATGGCVVDTTCAASDPCGNPKGGVCYEALGQALCYCFTGYKGTACDTCAAGYHDDNGTCVLNQTCLPGSCSGTDAGTCYSYPDVIACVCKGHHAGTYCEQCETGYTGYATGCNTCAAGYLPATGGTCAPDTDGDGVIDADDPCPTDACDTCGTPPDADGDGIMDCLDTDDTLVVNTTGNTGIQGFSFDMDIGTNMQLETLGVRFNGCTNTPTPNVLVYQKTGTSVGFESDPTPWTPIKVGAATCDPTTAQGVIPFENITLSAGGTYGFYVHGVDRSFSGVYTGAVGDVLASDTNLTVKMGKPYFDYFQPYPSNVGIGVLSVVYNTR